MSREPPGLTMVQPASLYPRRSLAIVYAGSPHHVERAASADARPCVYNGAFQAQLPHPYSLTNHGSVAKVCVIGRRSGQIAVAHSVPEHLVWALDDVGELTTHIDRRERSIWRTDHHRLRVGENLG